MNTRLKVYVLLFLNFLMIVSVYFFAYFMSVLVFAMGPLAWISNIFGFLLAYGGVGVIKEQALLILRNNEQEQLEFVSKLKVYRGNEVIYGIEQFRRYVLITIVMIVFATIFSLFLYSAIIQSEELQKVEQTMRNLFFVFSIIGAIVGLLPINKKIKALIQKQNIKTESK